MAMQMHMGLSPAPGSQAAGGGSKPAFANPQVLIITSDSQGKGTLTTADQNAAVAAYTVSDKIKVLNSSGAWVTYTPGTITGLDFGVNHGQCGPEIGFINRWRSKYPNDTLYIIKENVSGGFQTRGAEVTPTAVCSGSGNTLTVNSGTVPSNHLLVGTGIDSGIYSPFSGFLSKVGVAGGATATAFSNVTTHKYNGTLSWSSTEGLAYNGNSAGINNGARARIAAGLALLTNPHIAAHLHIIGTNDAGLSSASAFATDLTAFLDRINTDFSAYDSDTAVILPRCRNSGSSATTVRTATATEASTRANAFMIDMDAQSVQADNTHWVFAALSFMGDAAFTAKYGA